MGRYTKGRAIRQGNVGINPKCLPGVKRTICTTCQSHGVILQTDGRYELCPYGCKPRSHTVIRQLKKQDRLEARLEEIKRGNW